MQEYTVFVVSLPAACYIQQQPACMKRCFNRNTDAAGITVFLGGAV